jgi:hypothetical protein
VRKIIKLIFEWIFCGFLKGLKKIEGEKNSNNFERIFHEFLGLINNFKSFHEIIEGERI